MNRRTGERANRRTGQQANRRTGQQANGPTGQQANRPTGQQANRRTGQRANRPTGQQANNYLRASGLTMSSIGTTSADAAAIAMRNRRPLAAGAYNPPNSGICS